jgi:hypothetical protein
MWKVKKGSKQRKSNFLIMLFNLSKSRTQKRQDAVRNWSLLKWVKKVQVFLNWWTIIESSFNYAKIAKPPHTTNATRTRNDIEIKSRRMCFTLKKSFNEGTSENTQFSMQKDTEDQCIRFAVDACCIRLRMNNRDS